MTPIAIIVKGKNEKLWQLDQMPLKLWLAILGGILILFGVMPGQILIALGIIMIVISIFLYVRENLK